jgi:hypothetical protein
MQEHISPNDLMILYALTYKIKGILFSVEEKVISKNRLVALEFLNLEGKLTTKGKRLMIEYGESLTILEGKGRKSNKHVDDAILEAKITDFIEQYRILFKGKKPGAMGDLQGCKDKMLLFYKEYSDYADRDIILGATAKYINSINDYTYMKQADYFIYKEDNNKKKTSLLASFCEEIQMNNGVYNEIQRNEMI